MNAAGRPLLCSCSVALVYAYDGRVTGSAFVEFGTPDESKLAMGKDRQMIGNRYIELFVSSREDMARATCHNGGSSSHAPPSCVAITTPGPF